MERQKLQELELQREEQKRREKEEEERRKEEESTVTFVSDRKQRELEEQEREKKREEKVRKREQKQKEREERRNVRKLQREEQKRLQEKIALEERKLLLAQRNLQSIRLIAELLSRAKERAWCDSHTTRLVIQRYLPMFWRLQNRTHSQPREGLDVIMLFNFDFGSAAAYAHKTLRMLGQDIKVEL
eukprot:g40329.t1